jgi:beta-mannosidase
MPSFESLSASLRPEHYSLHSLPMAERNHPADGAVASYFGEKARLALNESGVIPLKRACYQSQLAQALRIKTEVELLRSSNSWGSLIWQLNDVYPSGSWGR